MNIVVIKHFYVGFMISEIPRVSVFGYFTLGIKVAMQIFRRTVHAIFYELITINFLWNY